jgi:hypothetical protein
MGSKSTSAAAGQPENAATTGDAAGFYHDDTAGDSAGREAAETPAIAWTASEFIAHAKSFGWYVSLAVAAIVFAGLVLVVSHDLVSVAVVLVAALLLGVYGSHQPRQMEYKLDASGLSVGKRHFGYNEFRSFSVMAEGAISSIVFLPLRRFAVPTTIYYAPEDETKIVDLLSSRLPLEQHKNDPIDRLMHHIRY